jgi:hypothetical protein
VDKLIQLVHETTRDKSISLKYNKGYVASLATASPTTSFSSTRAMATGFSLACLHILRAVSRGASLVPSSAPRMSHGRQISIAMGSIAAIGHRLGVNASGSARRPSKQRRTFTRDVAERQPELE